MLTKFRTMSVRQQFVVSAAIAMAVCLGLFTYGVYMTSDLKLSYLPWNLFLAAVPLIFALKLVHELRTKLWSSWSNLGWTLAWLLFLPNSFYMISDFIHLKSIDDRYLVYAAVLFTSFIYLAALFGFYSLYLVHRALQARVSRLASSVLIGGVLLACSFAIYIGRDLRWNSWDVITNPGGLIFDISDRVLYPRDYPAMLLTTGSFFALLGSLYLLIWAGAKVLRNAEPGRVTRTSK